MAKLFIIADDLTGALDGNLKQLLLDLLKGRYDAIVCMYHDQGHIPMKIVDFEGATNITLGLPIVRTSVDHDTAFDIAYKGIAFTSSLRYVVNLALKLAAN